MAIADGALSCALTDSGRRASRRSLIKGMGVAAIGITLGGLAGCGEHVPALAKIAGTGEPPELNFLTWDTYIGDYTLSDFKAASGVGVAMSFFSSNDELFAKLESGNSGCDVIVPSDDAVVRLSRAGLLEPLDHSLIPNFSNIAPEFQTVPYDPARRWSMPYTWLVMGIGYRKSKVNAVPDSWKVLFDSDEYQGRIALVSDAGDLFRLGALYQGHAINTMTPAMLPAIEAMLTRQKANVKAFHEDNGQDLLLSGEVDLVLEYNGDIAQAMAKDSDLAFVIPKEGSQLNADNLAIPKGAKHPKNAHAFINALLDARMGRDILETIKFPTPNAAAKALMPADYRNNPVIFPSAAELARCAYATFDDRMQPLCEAGYARIRAA
jgi:spermidine/putrescine transport system substrate-binding protein